MNEFGDFLKKSRIRHGVTQRELAEAVGVDFSYISKVETGVVPPPSHDTTIKIAQKLDENPVPMVALAGHVPRSVKEYLLSDPRIVVAVDRLARRGVDASALESMVDELGKR